MNRLFMAFFFCKNPQMWPKGPIQIVVWVAEGIRGYEVVSKHSKCSHTCGFFFFSGPLPEKRKLLVGISQTLMRNGGIRYGEQKTAYRSSLPGDSGGTSYD